MPTLEERVESLESILGQFIVHTDIALRRLEAEMKNLKDEMTEFKNEMRDFKDEMRDFKNEMLAFKDEMRDFKNEMLAFKDEMRDFKNEMLAFKDEMRDFKNEMLAFKDEMRDFKNETLEERKRAYKQWGELANKMGTIVEDMVIPNISGIAKKYFGCEQLEFFASRIKKRNTKDISKHREFDVIAIFENKIIVNETKSTPRISYIDDFSSTLKEFFDYFPEYKGKEIIPIFSSLYLSEDVIDYLTKNSIYAMAIKEDTMDILNFEQVGGKRYKL